MTKKCRKYNKYIYSSYTWMFNAHVKGLRISSATQFDYSYSYFLILITKLHSDSVISQLTTTVQQDVIYLLTFSSIYYKCARQLDYLLNMCSTRCLFWIIHVPSILHLISMLFLKLSLFLIRFKHQQKSETVQMGISRVSSLWMFGWVPVLIRFQGNPQKANLRCRDR